MLVIPKLIFLFCVEFVNFRLPFPTAYWIPLSRNLIGTQNLTKDQLEFIIFSHKLVPISLFCLRWWYHHSVTDKKLGSYPWKLSLFSFPCHHQTAKFTSQYAPKSIPSFGSITPLPRLKFWQWTTWTVASDFLQVPLVCSLVHFKATLILL